LALDAPIAQVNKANYDLDKKNTALNLANGNLNLPTYTNPGPAGSATPAVIPPSTALPSAALTPVAPSTSPSGSLFQLQFDASGKFKGYFTTDAAGVTTPLATSGKLTLTSSNPAIPTFDVTLDIKLATQYGTAFSISELTQDGYTAGDLTGINIGEDGKITTVYSNGQSQVNSQISLADFRNSQGLTPIASGAWVETAKSGQPIQGAPGDGKFGKLRSGALEESNVDLTAELVNMMTAQRSYQANVQTIKTQDQALQSLVNLR
jgi:flagellar hook protein FlgE